MKTHTLTRTQRIPATPEQAWAYFSDPRNLAELSPPGVKFEMLEDPPDELHQGLVLRHRLRPMLNVPVVWVSEIVEARRPEVFTDEQRSGPFRAWRHEHRFREIPGGVEVCDTVTYSLPMGPLGDLAHALFVRRQLEANFEFRRRAIEARFGTLEENT